MADNDEREPGEPGDTGGGVDSPAGAPTKAPLPKRFWAWFNEQGLVAKFLLTIVTAVATALVVGAVTRSVFSSSSDSPPPTTLAPGAAPFSISTRIIHGDYWKVWLDKPLPEQSVWPQPGADPDTLLQFVDELGAVDNLTWTRIVLDGTAGRTSTITGAHAIADKRSEPSPVASFSYPHEGEQEVLGLYFNLDEPDSPAHELIGFAAGNTTPYFANRTITVAPGEALTIDVNATTQTCDCTWFIKLDVVVDGALRTVRIDNNGTPFHTSAGKDGVPIYLWNNLGDSRGGIAQVQPDGTLAPATP